MMLANVAFLCEVNILKHEKKIIIRTKVDKLNVQTETWTSMPPLKEGRWNPGCALHHSTEASKSYVVLAGGSRQ